MTALISGPLVDAEIDELDNFLQADGLPEEAMDIAMLDGYLSALAVGPNLIPPSRWLPEIWAGGPAGEEMKWQSPAQAERITGLILRHANAILAQLQAEPEDWQPLLYAREEDGREIAMIDEWCIGFVRGINQDNEAWQTIMDDTEAEEFMLPILLFGTDAGWQEMENDSELAAGHAEFADALPDCVLAIYDYWTPQRGKRTTVRHDAPRPGRNDPCPCGSGRKFKKCCGATEQLH